MPRQPSGKGVRPVPVITGGFTDVVYPRNGQARRVDGVFFTVSGTVERTRGLNELVDWSALPFLGNRIDAMVGFKAPKGPNELVFSYGGTVSHATRLTVTTITADRRAPASAAEGEYFTQRNDWLFMSNGVDANLKWNGRYTAPVGVHERPLAPTADGIEDSGFSPDHSFPTSSTDVMQYRATFVNTSGHEGPPSEAGVAAALDTPTNLALVKITGLNAPSASDLIYRNIYKRAADGEYYFWRQVASHVEVVYDHEAPLAVAASGTPLVAVFPPPTSKFIAFFRGRGFYVDPNFPSFIFYSDAGLPEQISSAFNFLEVTSDDGDEITGLVSYNDSLVVFKRRSMWRITALADGTPVLRPISQGVGSVAPRASLLAYDKLIFIGQLGVYEFDGGSVRSISNMLDEWWTETLPDFLKNAVGWLDERQRRLFFAVPHGANAENDVVLSFHYEIGAWSLTKGHKISAATNYKGMQLVAAQSTAANGNYDVFLWSNSNDFTVRGYAGNGSPSGTTTVGEMRGALRIGPMSAGDSGFRSGEEMEVEGFDIFFPYAGSHTITVSWYKDRNPVPVGTMTIQLNQHGVLANIPENQDLTALSGWGEKVWGGGTWNGPRQLFQRVWLPNSVTCREISIELKGEVDDEPWAVDSLILWRTAKGSDRQR